MKLSVNGGQQTTEIEIPQTCEEQEGWTAYPFQIIFWGGIVNNENIYKLSKQ